MHFLDNEVSCTPSMCRNQTFFSHLQDYNNHLVAETPFHSMVFLIIFLTRIRAWKRALDF